MRTCLTVLALLVTAVATPAAAAERADIVVVLPGPLPGNFMVQDAIRWALASPALPPLDYHTEFIEDSRFPGDEYRRLLHGFLRDKYAARPVRLVFAVGPTALRFLTTHGHDLFPGVPIVFAGVRPEEVPPAGLPANVTGVWRPNPISATLDAALRLQPETQRAVVIAGVSASEQALLASARAELAPYAQRLQLSYVDDRSLPELVEDVRALPPRTVVLYLTLQRDRAGGVHLPHEALARISRAAAAPVYSLFETYLGSGTVGGRVISFRELGTEAGELGREILLGGAHVAMPPPREADSLLLFDWRELRRWGLDEGTLPAGARVLFRGLTFWGAYGGALIVTAVSLLEAVLIAVLFWQWRRRRRAERSLTERLRFEEILAALNGRFVGLTANDVPAETVRSLGEVGEFLGVDRAILVAPDERSGVFRVRGWSRPGVKPGPAAISISQFPWTVQQMRCGQMVCFSRLDDLPPEAAADRRTFATIGACSVIVIPLVADHVMLGSLSFSTVRAERAWPAELVQRLRLLAEVFANVLARRRADEALRQSRALSIAIVDSLPGKVMVLDQARVIIAASESAVPGASCTSHLTVGVDYLERWRVCAAEGDRAAAEILRGLTAVLDGTAEQFVAEYQPVKRGEGRWLELRVHPLRSDSGGAVVSRLDVTERKHTELEARRVRDELARVGRLVTVGQLTASLAHEVKQPLTGILTNAQVARRLLATREPDLTEIRAILDDIVRDDQRAADVIQRLRAMLKRHEPEVVLLDANRLIRDVVRFLHSDAVLRTASIALELAPGLPAVRGDVVQLQQVLVNLVLNGLDSMKGVPTERRRLLIRTERAADGVRVAVRDTGPGLDAASRERIFEPFYTTKSEGMGLGLPIARTLVEAAGGRLWVADPDGEDGATFMFTLPGTGEVMAEPALALAGDPIAVRR